MREYRRASIDDLYVASGCVDDENFLNAVMVLLEEDGYTPVVVKNRKGEQVLSIKREWLEGDMAIKRYTWKQMVSEAFDNGRSLYEHLLDKLKKGKESTAQSQLTYRQAGEAKKLLGFIEPYI